MNPNGPQPAEFNLPAPVEQAPDMPNMAPEATAAAPEMAAAQPEQAPGSAPAATLPMPPAITPPVTTQPALPTQNAVSTTTQTVAPITADDSDLIEKEWVQKAKQIIAASREDPYRQNQQLTVLKADYLQKRYNKAVKLAE